jgi:uncharacterized protein YbaP (TraB family)
LHKDLADTLVFEMDPAAINDPDFAFRLLKASSLLTISRLGTVLSEATYKQLSEKCKQNGFSIKMLNKTKPSIGHDDANDERTGKIGCY